MISSKACKNTVFYSGNEGYEYKTAKVQECFSEGLLGTGFLERTCTIAVI
ncbi:hypothetical protein SAMN04488542_14116 [Fontibacillus panacisegetis]|uniref:Uncharacterized protein n=1 Tax=Fontibacillus panacisegetis TaxID=670482 RepID=A0A1G7U3H8_9BACL|nr:hypothetical protein [Fontibacillus panacisegetis]SDG41330.1 hypothetical protein SAMN04488542_14116 [Fontibacillus panacisegetis]